MTRDVQHVDSWKATVHARLGDVQAAILDLIDVGPTEAPAERACPDCRREGRCGRFPKCCWPAKAVRVAMDRAIEVEPPVRGHGGGAVSDPTYGQVSSWESEVQRATTWLFEVVAAAVTIAAAPGVVPVDQDGRKIPAPAEPAAEQTASGRWRVVAPVTVTADAGAEPTQADCRRSTLAAVRYVGAVADALAGRMEDEPDRDVAGSLRDHAGWLGQSVHRLARRLSPVRVALADDRVCGCDGENCSHGPGACRNVSDRHVECRSCRRRQSREAS